MLGDIDLIVESVNILYSNLYTKQLYTLLSIKRLILNTLILQPYTLLFYTSRGFGLCMHPY